MNAGSEATSALAEAWAAFGRSDWSAARDAFERANEAGAGPEALDGLGQSVMWLGDEERAIELRAKAFAGYRRLGEGEAAANVAVYIASEYRIAGNWSLANGWLGRAVRLLEESADCPALGWLHIERAKRAPGPKEAEANARKALEVARRIHDVGIEAAALSHAGLARVSAGDVDAGLELLEEALTIATAGEADDPLSIGDACCTTLVACERLADPRRARDWGQAIASFMRRRNFLPLSPWCRSVYAGFLITTGRWVEAEGELAAALEEASLVPSGHDAAPRTYLAELRLRQGRLEEAELLLAELGSRPAALATAVMLHLARGELELAAEKVGQRLEAARDEPDIIVAPLHLLRARVELARSSLETAEDAIRTTREMAARLGREDLGAAADIALARVARLRNQTADVRLLEAAVECFAGLDMVLEEGEARLELARALARGRPRLATEQGRAALLAFERLGAARHADLAAAFLRGLGAPGRPAPRTGTTLTRRELEVLGLLREGLTNTEIADRLVISPRTAEHHVRSILAKLQLRNRAEAAAYAAREGAVPRR